MPLKKVHLPTLPSLLGVADEPFIHRDLSALQFNERVLDEARTHSNPLLERAKFLAITASNLDEFFMIRYPSIVKPSVTPLRQVATGAKNIRIRNHILELVTRFVSQQSEILDLISSELLKFNIQVIRQTLETEDTFEISKSIFGSLVLPFLVAPAPFTPAKMSTQENLQLAVIFSREAYWFKIPKTLPSVYLHRKSNEILLFFLDDLLLTHVGNAFGFTSSATVTRVTRDEDFTVDLDEEDTSSIPDIVRTGIKARERGRPMRLQYIGDLDDQLLKYCLSKFHFTPGQVFLSPVTLCLSGTWSALGQIPEQFKNDPKLTYPAFKSIIPPELENANELFDILKTKDILLHHPYDSFESYVKWIIAACNDPHVEMIQQTVYRMDTLSPVIEALKLAAKTKKIRIVIELRARFDELNNLRLAEEMRQAGINVHFGFGKLKLHAKIALIQRREGSETKYYTHLSTGNYNATTARQYEDLAIMTANPEFGSDAAHFFDSVCVGHVPKTFKLLVPAPIKLHKKLINLIQAETKAASLGHSARIVAKINALVDNAVVTKLYEASQAGVQVDLIVRGACSLIPGVKGLSDNIRVISVVDRYLEHSRIYYFAHSKEMYLSSADWMPRNFFSRLELAFPIKDPAIFNFIESFIIPAYLCDTVKSRELTPHGTWKRRTITSLVAPLKKTAQALGGAQAIRAQFLFEFITKKK